MTAFRVSYDWPRILGDLAHVLGKPDPENPAAWLPAPQWQLAEHFGVSRGAVRGWLDGSEPKHADGEAVLTRWSQLTGKSRTFAPLARRPLYAATRQGR